MADESSVRSYPPTAPVTVSAEEIKAFATAIGAPVSDEAPPTFAIKIARPAWQHLFDDPELGLALERTIHAEQIFTTVRPICAGDEVRALLRLDKFRRRGGMAHVKVSVDIVDAHDVVLVEGKSTFLSHDAPQEDAA